MRCLRTRFLNPYSWIFNAMMRTHYCGSLTEAQIDQTVTLCGWVHRRRDHGGVIFLDMRDRDGLVQVVIDPDTP